MDILERCHSCNEAGSTHPRCCVVVHTPILYSLLVVVLLGANLVCLSQFRFSNNNSDHCYLTVIIIVVIIVIIIP